MKKLFAIAVLALVVLASCKKTSSGLTASTTGTFRTTIGDTTYTFDKGTEGYSYNGTAYLYALDSVGVQANGFDIDIRSYDGNDNHLPLKVGTYKNDDTTQVRAYFYPYNSDEFESNYNKPFQVTITSISLSNIQGNYTGIIYLNGDTTLASKNVSGQFNINTTQYEEY